MPPCATTSPPSPSSNACPDHRREYIAWIEEAKPPATRERRVHSTVERVKEPRRPSVGYSGAGVVSSMKRRSASM